MRGVKRAAFELEADERITVPCPDCAAEGSLRFDETITYVGDLAQLVEEQREVVRAGRRLRDVVGQIFDASQLETGKLALTTKRSICRRSSRMRSRRGAPARSMATSS
jgi:hypothetical protein